MANIVLTDSDFSDLSEGATINAMDDDGKEYIIGPRELNKADLALLLAGKELWIGMLRISYPE